MSSRRARRMAALYHEEGLTLQEIGDDYGISRERVRQLLADAGRPSRRSVANARVPRRAAAAVEAQREEILALYRGGRNAADIARQLPGVTRAAVRTLLQDSIGAAELIRIRSQKAKAGSAHRRASEDQMIAVLRAAAEELGPNFRMTDFAVWARRRGVVGPQTYIYRFGTWSAARDLAGLKALGRRRKSRPDRVSADECLAAIGEVAAGLGRLPSAQEYERAASGNALPSLSTIRKRFGDWGSALASAEKGERTNESL